MTNATHSQKQLRFNSPFLYQFIVCMPHHHPFWYHHPKHYYNRMLFCGPSRLVWFGIGSVATWAWIHHHHRHDDGPDHKQWGWGCDRRRVEYRGGRAQWEREEAAAAASGANASASADYGEQQHRQQIPSSLSREWRPTMHQGTGQREPAAAAAAARVAGAEARPQSPVHDHDTEHLRQIGRNAEEAISGMSEATIDGVMGALQRLKDRLAERRAQQQWEEIESQRSNSTPASPPGQSRHVV